MNRRPRSRFVMGCTLRSVESRCFPATGRREKERMGNHKGRVRKRLHRALFLPFSTPITAFFRTLRPELGTVQHDSPKTLLAGMDTALAETIILPPAVVPQEEGPFQPPFPAAAHRSPSSGGFFSGRGFSACRAAHSRLASSNLSRMEGFSGFVCSACSCAFSRSSPRLPLLITPSIIP